MAGAVLRPTGSRIMLFDSLLSWRSCSATERCSSLQMTIGSWISRPESRVMVSCSMEFCPNRRRTVSGKARETSARRLPVPPAIITGSNILISLIKTLLFNTSNLLRPEAD